MTAGTNWIQEYWRQITTGEVTVGQWIRLLYERIINGLNDGTYAFDARAASRAVDFIENFCHHHEGRCDLLKLELWQKAAVSVIFGVMDPSDGYRQWREVFLVVSRKMERASLRRRSAPIWRIWTESTVLVSTTWHRSWSRQP